MSEKKLPTIDLNIVLEEAKAPSQVNEIKGENTKTLTTNTGPVNQEMPTVTSLLNRKKLSVSKDSLAENNTSVGNISTLESKNGLTLPKLQVLGPSDQSVSISKNYAVPQSSVTLTKMHRTNHQGKTPPSFKKLLWVPKVSIQNLKLEILKHRKSLSLMRRDILGCLSLFFTEVSYFEKRDNENFFGKIGFVENLGNPLLTNGIWDKVLDKNTDPLLKQIFMGKKKIIHKKINQQSAADQSLCQVLQKIGFDSEMTDILLVGVYKRKMLFFKTCMGIWICSSKKTSRLQAGDLKILSKAIN